MRIIDKRGRSEAFVCTGVVRAESAPKLALAMRNLYLSCVRQVVLDADVAFHAVLMPGMPGGHYLYSSEASDDLDTDVAELLGVAIGHRDCIVVMGKDFLSVRRTREEMLAEVVSDVAFHLSRLMRVPDPSLGAAGHNIGWAATAATIIAAHDVIGFQRFKDILIDKVKDAAQGSLIGSQRPTALPGGAIGNRLDLELVERVCDRALETKGGFLTLPNEAREIADTARCILLDVVDGG
jgi:hypothetical protein